MDTKLAASNSSASPALDPETATRGATRGAARTGQENATKSNQQGFNKSDVAMDTIACRPHNENFVNAENCKDNKGNEEEECSLPCEICCPAVSKGNMVEQMRRRQAMRILLCEKCSVVFSEESVFLQHLREHHNIALTQVCKRCLQCLPNNNPPGNDRMFNHRDDRYIKNATLSSSSGIVLKSTSSSCGSALKSTSLSGGSALKSISLSGGSVLKSTSSSRGSVLKSISPSGGSALKNTSLSGGSVLKTTYSSRGSILKSTYSSRGSVLKSTYSSRGSVLKSTSSSGERVLMSTSSSGESVRKNTPVLSCYICMFCNRAIDGNDQETHNNACTHCPQDDASQISLNAYWCEACVFACNDRSEMETHLSCHDKSCIAIICPVCTQKCQQKDDFVLHVQEQHMQTLFCVCCHRDEFASKDQLSSHLLNHINQNWRNLEEMTNYYLFICTQLPGFDWRGTPKANCDTHHVRLVDLNGMKLDFTTETFIEDPEVEQEYYVEMGNSILDETW